MTGQTLTVEQFTQSVAENIAKQFDLQPSELIKSLVDRLSTKLVDALVKKQNNAPIQQKPTESKASVVSDGNTKNVPTILNKGFETLIKFLQTPKTSAISRVAKEASFAVESKKSLLEGKEEPKPFLFAGFTEQGLKQLEDKLPDVIKKGIKGLFYPKNDETKSKKGQTTEGIFENFLSPKALKGALSVLTGIGGILLLLDGVRTSEWYKGLEKIAGKGLMEVSGFSKLIEGFAKKIVSNLVKIPARLIGLFSKSIMSMFGKEAGEVAVKTGLGAAKELIPKMLGGLLKFIKKVPLIGSLISVGFAVDRFTKGDIIGGGLEILSALTGLLYLTPATAPFAFPLSLAIDSLNAFLDYKAGGIGEQAKQTKGDIIGQWLKEAGSWIYEKVQGLPIIGNIIKAGKFFAEKDWEKGLVQLSRVIPGVGWLLDTVGITEDKQEVLIGKELDVIKNLFDWIKTSIWDKVKGIIGNTTETIKEWWNSAVNFVTGDEEAPKIGGSLTSTQASKPSTRGEAAAARDAKPVQTGDAMIKPDGGLIVSSPTEGSLFQLSKNDGIVAAPITESVNPSSGASFAKAETILERIAENTGHTNQGMYNLINGFNNLAKALKEAGVNIGQNVTVVNSRQQEQSKFAGVAQHIAAMNSPARSYNDGFAGMMKPVRI